MDKTREGLLDDMALFAKHQLLTQDIESEGPMLEYVQRGLDRDAAIWHTILYVVYTTLPSGVLAFEAWPSPVDAWKKGGYTRFPITTERRGLRVANNLQRHLESWELAYRQGGNSLYSWLTQDFKEVGTPWAKQTNWTLLVKRLRSIEFNGRWAAHKTAGLLKSVNHFPVDVVDIGILEASGPRKGLELFFPHVSAGKYAGELLDTQLVQLLFALEERDVKLDLGDLESLLCEFHSLHEGRYYVGRDIDRQGGELLAARALVERTGATMAPIDGLWDARSAILDKAYLGEYATRWEWDDSPRRRIYQETGQVVVRKDLDQWT